MKKEKKQAVLLFSRQRFPSEKEGSFKICMCICVYVHVYVYVYVYVYVCVLSAHDPRELRHGTRVAPQSITTLRRASEFLLGRVLPPKILPLIPRPKLEEVPWRCNASCKVLVEHGRIFFSQDARDSTS